MTDGSKPISRRQRFEILRRDQHTCRYCGARAPDVPLTVDHVLPRALGGSDDPTNLVTACRDCNAGKASTSPDENIVADVDAAALLFARAMERAADQRRSQLEHRDGLHEMFARAWENWTYEVDGEKRTCPRDSDWRSSVDRFVDLGLDGPDLGRFILVAMRSKARNHEKWKYFCGCCWNEITDRQERARRLIEDGVV